MISESVCADIISSLKSCGINFLAIDFDQTLVSEHTYGQWQGTPAELAVTVRPFFRTLLPLLGKTDISIAICTFSGQVQTIAAVLRLVFPEIASQIIIRGEDRSWLITSECVDGKQPHMASAAEEFMKNDTCQIITRNTTLLLDDDANNVRIAIVNKVRAVVFDLANIQRTVDDLLRVSKEN